MYLYRRAFCFRKIIGAGKEIAKNDLSSRTRKTIQVCASKIWGQVLNRIFQALIDDGVQMTTGQCAQDTKLDHSLE